MIEERTTVNNFINLSLRLCRKDWPDQRKMMENLRKKKKGLLDQPEGKRGYLYIPRLIKIGIKAFSAGAKRRFNSGKGENWLKIKGSRRR